MDTLNGNGNVLGQKELLSEIKLAESENRAPNFSNKTISDFSILVEKIKFGLNLTNAKIMGPVFLGEVVILGDLNMKGAIVNGSLYLGKADIKEDLIMENAQINGAINLVGARIGGNLDARGLITAGFISLSKTEIARDVILENAEISSANYDDMMVRGDAFLGAAIVKGNLNLGKMKTEGTIDLEETEVGSNLVLTGAESKKGAIDTTTVKIGGKKII
jgi:uncharacterized protein YjbI with pentapeptide repeats